ncbi:MAG: hypothetical protein ACLT9Y_01770 [Peptostreptococcus anaerobius]
MKRMRLLLQLSKRMESTSNSRGYGDLKGMGISRKMEEVKIEKKLL